MGDFDVVFGAVVGDGVYARDFAASYVVDAECVGGCLAERPALFTVELGYGLLGEGDSCT